MNRSRRLRLSARKGLALPMAIGSIVLIGMILAGVFFSATQENRVGRNTITQERAFRAAEYGLNNAYASWNNSVMSKLATGAIATIGDKQTSRGFADTVQVTHLNTNTYLLVSTGYAGSGSTQALHRTSNVIRLNFPAINVLAALTLRGALKLGGSSFIDGHDTPPFGLDGLRPPRSPAARYRGDFGRQQPDLLFRAARTSSASTATRTSRSLRLPATAAPTSITGTESRGRRSRRRRRSP